MSLCNEELEGVFRAIRDSHGWDCEALANGDALITTGRVRADSEPIQLFARLEGDVLTLSDGAETVNRLDESGFSRDDPALREVWTEALLTYRVAEIDDRVFLRTSLDTAARALNRFADVLVALDGLRVIGLPAPSKTRTLADEVGDYLADIYSGANVSRSPRIELRGGLVVTPALRVDTSSRSGILVQPGAASSPTQSYDHAYATFSLARRGGVALPNCLVVLGGSVPTWNLTRLRALSDLAFVGFWEHRSAIHSFLDGELPDDPLMVPQGLDVPMLDV